MARSSHAPDPQALLDKASQLHQAGQLQQAAGHYRKYLRLQPQHAEVWHTLAGLYFQGGKLEAAQSALMHAVQAAPDNADYVNDLGGLYLTRKDYSHAADSYRKVLALNPDHHGARYNLSQVLFEQGHAAEAIELLQRLVTDKPDYVEAHYNLGIALHSQGQYQAAIEALERVLTLQPGFISAHVQLAVYCQEHRQLQKAIRHYRKALGYQPDDPIASRGLADCLHEEGETVQAIELLKAAVQKHTENAELHAALGRIRHEHGELQAAEANYLQALELDAANSLAVQGLAAVRQFSPVDQILIDRIKALTLRIDKDQADALHFALGKIYDDCRDYERAFEHYRQANQLRRKNVLYSESKYEKRLQGIIEFFTAERIEALQAFSSDSELPVFIIGMPRSGTTLTEQILAAHPQAHGAGELAYFNSMLRGLPQLLHDHSAYPACIAGMTEAVAQQVTDGYLGLLRRHHEYTLRISDKMPGNFWHLGLIASLFPNAKLIHCRRDPLDVCMSIYFQSFAPDQGHDYAWDLREIAHYYNHYRQVMQHWQSVLPGRILDINYDDLIEEPETHARLLIEYCGLDWDPACLEFHKARREVRTASNWQVRQPIYKTSSRRWENYRQHLGEVMEILGYEEHTEVAG